VRVSYNPSMVNLTHNVNIVAKDVISVVSAIPRIRGQTFTEPNPPAVDDNHHGSISVNAATAAAAAAAAVAAAAAMPPPVAAKEEVMKSYYEMVSDDPDILRIVVQVMNGMSSTATGM
jgi:hypothetical protein